MSRHSRIALIGFTSLALVLFGWWWNTSASSAVASGRLPPDDATPTPISTRSTATPRPVATPTPAPLPDSARVPILMYHYISTPPRNADKYRIDLSVTPQDFERQLQFLRTNDYTAISLYDLYDHLTLGRSLPPKPVVLTFDDGYRDQYENAFPLLKKYGMAGTFFLSTDFINAGNPNYLTWKMVREMSDAGMRIESQGRTHSDLRQRDFQFLVWEILGPIEQITAYTGKRPRFFCYPAGRYDDDVIRVLRSVQTWAALTTEPGSTYTRANLMTWPRVRVRGPMTVDQFAALLAAND